MLVVAPEFGVADSGWGSVCDLAAAETQMPSQGAKQLGEVRQQGMLCTLNHQLMTYIPSHQEIAESLPAAVAAVLVKHLQTMHMGCYYKFVMHGACVQIYAAADSCQAPK